MVGFMNHFGQLVGHLSSDFEGKNKGLLPILQPPSIFAHQLVFPGQIEILRSPFASDS